MNHEVYKEMLELEALGMLEEAESISLHEHLATCAECRTELAALSNTVAALVYLTPPVTPSPQVLERILESIASRPRGAHAEPTPDANSSKSGEATQVSSVVPRHQTGRSAQSSGVSQFMHRWGALAASIVIAVLLILLVVLWSRNREMQAELARLSKHNDEMQTELIRLSQRENALQAELARVSTHDDNTTAPRVEIAPSPAPINRPPEEGATGQQQASASPTPVSASPTPVNVPPDNVPRVVEVPIVPDADARVVALAGTKEAPQAQARLAYNNRTRAMTLSVSGMPPAPAGKAYQLWFQVKGRFLSGPVFTVGPQGQASISGQVPAGASNASAYVVTLENSNGANKPTGAKYLLGSVS